jgi:capsular polysaccharide biosynthesis protein
MAAQSLFDPAFATLYQAVQSAQVDIDNADQQVSQATSQTAGNTFLVYDPPSTVWASLSKKSLALDLVIGLVVGLLLSGAFIVGTTAFDHSLRYAHEVPDLLGVPVLASVAYGKDLAHVQHSPVSKSGTGATDGKRVG